MKTVRPFYGLGEVRQYRCGVSEEHIREPLAVAPLAHVFDIVSARKEADLSAHPSVVEIERTQKRLRALAVLEVSG